MKLAWPRLLALLLLMVLAGCGSGGSDATRKIDFVPLRSIEVTAPSPLAAAGTKIRFTAIGYYGDSATFQFTRDITSIVSWTSSDANLLVFADPAAAGLATTLAAGPVTVTATLGTIAGDLPFTVSNATISTLAITPPSSPNLNTGETLQLRATGVFSDSSSQDLTETVAWSSNNLTVATVANTLPGAGLVTALAVGTVDISAGFAGLETSQTLNVMAPNLTSMTVTSAAGSATMAMGTSMQFIATGTYTDGSSKVLTSQVTWASNTPTVAQMDQTAGTSGMLSALATGTTTVTASLNGITSPSFPVTVSSATLSSLVISSAGQTTVLVNQTLPLTATGNFSDGSSQDVTRDVTWSSAAPSIATVSLSSGTEGIVKGIAPGSVSITANSNKIAITGTVTINATYQVTVQ